MNRLKYLVDKGCAIKLDVMHRKNKTNEITKYNLIVKYKINGESRVHGVCGKDLESVVECAYEEIKKEMENNL